MTYEQMLNRNKYYISNETNNYDLVSKWNWLMMRNTEISEHRIHDVYDRFITMTS